MIEGVIFDLDGTLLIATVFGVKGSVGCQGQGRQPSPRDSGPIWVGL